MYLGNPNLYSFNGYFYLLASWWGETREPTIFWIQCTKDGKSGGGENVLTAMLQLPKWLDFVAIRKN